MVKVRRKNNKQEVQPVQPVQSFADPNDQTPKAPLAESPTFVAPFVEGGVGSQSFQESQNGGQPGVGINNSVEAPAVVNVTPQGANPPAETKVEQGQVDADALGTEFGKAHANAVSGNVPLETTPIAQAERVKSHPQYGDAYGVASGLSPEVRQQSIRTAESVLADPNVDESVKAQYRVSLQALRDYEGSLNAGPQGEPNETQVTGVDDGKVVNGTNVKGSNDDVVNETPELKVNDGTNPNKPLRDAKGHVLPPAVSYADYAKKYAGGEAIADADKDGVKNTIGTLRDNELFGAIDGLEKAGTNWASELVSSLVDRGYQIEKHNDGVYIVKDNKMVYKLKEGKPKKDETVVQGTGKNVGDGTDGKGTDKKDDAGGDGNDGKGNDGKDEDKLTAKDKAIAKWREQGYGEDFIKSFSAAWDKDPAFFEAHYGDVSMHDDGDFTDHEPMPDKPENPDLQTATPYYDQVLKGLEATRKAREEKKEKDIPKNKARRAIATIADVLANFANIWGAAHGATPAQLSSLSKADQARIATERAELKQTEAEETKKLESALKRDLKANEAVNQMIMTAYKAEWTAYNNALKARDARRQQYWKAKAAEKLKALDSMLKMLMMDKKYENDKDLARLKGEIQKEVRQTPNVSETHRSGEVHITYSGGGGGGGINEKIK